MPMGRLTRKMECQPNTGQQSAEQLTDAAAGRSDETIDAHGTARSVGSVNSVMIKESDTAVTTAPPTPWSARPAISSDEPGQATGKR